MTPNPAEQSKTPRTDRAAIPAHYVTSKYEEGELFVPIAAAQRIELELAALQLKAERLDGVLDALLRISGRAGEASCVNLYEAQQEAEAALLSAPISSP